MNPNEWFNQILPLSNTPGMKNQALLRVGPTSTGVDLRSLFGDAQGHYYTLKARSAGPAAPSGVAAFCALVSLSANPLAISETLGGGATGQGWPLLDGQDVRGQLMGGKERASGGYATMAAYTTLNVKGLTGGQTGWLHVYRSSVSAPQDTQFPIPTGAIQVF
jgi:hypothetical protein